MRLILHSNQILMEVVEVGHSCIANQILYGAAPHYNNHSVISYVEA